MDTNYNHSNSETQQREISSRALQAPASSSVIQSTRKNCMGTMTLMAKFPGMRKAQDFCVYPLNGNSEAQTITIQSDTRIGGIDLATGWVKLSKSHSSGAYFQHLAECTNVIKLDAAELLMLKGEIFATAAKRAGTNGAVTCDNSGAARVFGEA